MWRLSVIALALVAWNAPAAAQSAKLSGQQVVEATCVKCHGTGTDGAPVIGDRAAWAPRVSRGLDAAIDSAIHGHGKMPARGGMASLTDGEIRAAIVYMFNAGGVRADTAGVLASVPEANRRVVHGTEIYLGVTPADALRKRLNVHHTEQAMHGGIPKGSGYYHVNISLLDAKSKADIEDAQVKVRVGNPTRGETKVLERMSINGMVSYGQYFRAPTRDRYTISVEVHRAGEAVPIETRFPLNR